MNEICLKQGITLLNTFNNLSCLFINKKKEYNLDQTTNMGENCQRRCIPIPPPSGFSAKMRDIMDLSWYNAELEMRYLSDEEIELLNQLRNY